jgi:hypothetical protein
MDTWKRSEILTSLGNSRRVVPVSEPLTPSSNIIPFEIYCKVDSTPQVLVVQNVDIYNNCFI